jgi:peroxiredoxin Q/BCP
VDYGVLGKFMMMTITKRESFIIDPDGLIVKHYKNVDPDKHTDEVIEELKSLQKKA